MKKSALVIGDIMLDKYILVKTVKISDEAPVLVVKEDERIGRLGGGANVAQSLKNLGMAVTVSGVVGVDMYGDKIKELLHKADIKAMLLTTPKIKTTCKRRYSAKNQQLLRVDTESRFEGRILPYLRDEYMFSEDQYDVIVISDYDKGCVNFTCNQLKSKKIVVNGKPSNLDKYRGCGVLIFNSKEAEEALIKLKALSHPIPVPSDICKEYGITYLVVTRGSDGIELYTDEGLLHKEEGKKVNVVDITGAGDTVTSVVAMCLAYGVTMQDAISLANMAAAVKVTKLFTSPISQNEITEVYPEESMGLLEKFNNPEDL